MSAWHFGRKCFLLLLVPLWSIILIPSTLIADDDIIILKNGDKITGEIKVLNKADLSIDPDYGENIFVIDWNEVDYIESKREFISETSGGNRLIGTIKTDPESKGKILIEGDGGTIRIGQFDLVYLKPLEEDFWGRLDISVDFGLGLTKANDTKQLNARLTGGYLAEKWSTNLRLDALLNTRSDAEDTKRVEFNSGYRRYLTDRWFGLGKISLLHSKELELDLRSTLGGGAGNSFIKNNRWMLSAAGGLVWTNENYVDPALKDKNSAEAFAGVELDIFDIGDLDIVSSYTVYPSLTESGRVRMNFSTDFQWELISDLFFRVGITDNYDSSPPSETQNNDYVFSTSIGWSY